MTLLAARIGSVIRYCEPYAPEAKAKIERWFRTCKEHWMRVVDWNTFSSLEAAEESLLSYVNSYNNTPHSSLGMSPGERFFSEPQYIIRLPEKKIKESFFLEKRCRVSADNVIILDKRQYEVPYIYSKQRITIRYAHDLSEVYVVNTNGELKRSILSIRLPIPKSKRKDQTERGQKVNYIMRYGLEYNPFIKTARILLFKSSDYKETIFVLNYLKDIKGFGVITGEAGKENNHLSGFGANPLTALI